MLLATIATPASAHNSLSSPEACKARTRFQMERNSKCVLETTQRTRCKVVYAKANNVA